LGSSKMAKERKAVPFWKTSLFFFSRMVPSIINCDSIIRKMAQWGRWRQLQDILMLDMSLCFFVADFVLC
jgi:hypothetical protein